MLGSILPWAGASFSTVAQRAGQQLEAAFSFVDQLRAIEAEVAVDESSDSDSGAEPSPLAVSLQRFHAQAVSLLRAAGVDLSFPVELSMDAQGNIAVSGAHPDLPRIEEVIAAHRELSEAAAEIVQQHGAQHQPYVGHTRADHDPFGTTLTVELDAVGITIRT